MKYVALFENITGAITKDVIIDENEDRLIFVVKAGDIG
jgi:N utilization substance protein A